MYDKPKHRQLLPLFVGQPVIMCVLAAAVLLIASLAWGIARACFQLWQLEGIGAFLPSVTALWLVIPAGLSVAMFNIAEESAELDACQGRQKLSLYTHGVLVLSLFFFAGWLEGLLVGTSAAAYFLQPAWFAFIIGVAYAAGRHLVRDSHRRDYEREQRILASRLARDGGSQGQTAKPA